ncbi:MAG: hypothetical protein HYV26_19235 [Candidatus Hydrogenedentes bacterium]|nr:hypothetical protein [Candidatus Hydrogenedentota bacterium]
MTPEEFVTGIIGAVFKSSIEGTLSLLQKVPGRKPPPDLVKLSDWFMHLSDSDKRKVADAVALSAYQATFGFLAVLDGARQIQDSDGSFELRYGRNEEYELVNDPDGEQLHNLFDQRAALFGGKDE